MTCILPHLLYNAALESSLVGIRRNLRTGTLPMATPAYTLAHALKRACSPESTRLGPTNLSIRPCSNTAGAPRFN